MSQAARSTVWVCLIVSGVIAVLLSFVLTSEAMTVLVAAGVGVIWTAWAILSAWLFGLRRHVLGHMACQLEELTFVSKNVGASRIVDYINTLEHLYESTDCQRFGAKRDRMLTSIQHTNIPTENVEWNTIESVAEELISVPVNPVYLMRHEGEAFAVRLSSQLFVDHFGQEDAWSTASGFASLEIVAHSLEKANVILRWLSGQTAERSMYRGKMLHISTPQDGTAGQNIRVSAPPEASRDDIVLPQSLVDLVERLVHGRRKHHARLREFGHKTKLGLLLHGAPGTGKTLLTKYLITSCDDHTVVVPSDLSVETLRESFRMAKYLQPSILVIEDVDLLAPRRETNLYVDRLQELMNELDGLGEGSDTIVIMSTNRPEVLEPALASRPGRVSQTIEFPLPDEPLRRDLLKLYLGDTCGGERLLDQWANRTDKASPAFLEELCKRAILIACERTETAGSETKDIDVQFNDLDAAIHELVIMGGDLTTKVLGFANSDQE